MIHIDLIVPWLSFFKKFLRFPRPGHMFYYTWFPVWYYKKDLKQKGLKIRFLDIFNLKHTKLSKIVGISSNIPYFQRNMVSTLKSLKKKVDFLIWFDLGDSTRMPNLRAIPYVDRYLKRQILKDLSLYRKNFYKDTIWIDNYIRNYDIDPKGVSKGRSILDQKYESKLGLAWNWALCDYRCTSKLSQYLYLFNRKNILKFCKPNLNRKYLFSANFYTSRSSVPIYYQREQLYKFLLKKYKSYSNVSIGRIPKKEYLMTQRSSKTIFSPFGWGEICLRDFETFIAGATLIKPNMEHLITWPDLFRKNETYIPISWKIEDWEHQIPEILSDEKQILKIAKNGQKAYAKLWTKDGKDEFCKRFIEMVTPD